jgi:hypothetical protein
MRRGRAVRRKPPLTAALQGITSLRSLSCTVSRTKTQACTDCARSLLIWFAAMAATLTWLSHLYPEGTSACDNLFCTLFQLEHEHINFILSALC